MVSGNIARPNVGGFFFYLEGEIPTHAANRSPRYSKRVIGSLWMKKIAASALSAQTLAILVLKLRPIGNSQDPTV